ncbi:MAG: hypothetical protein K5798_00680 [Nitrosopumilus sp.]|uniref:PEFG-CTERM sorting domain-containing protein n=1 Tax=Nitrosopumilus zosterae TaxID=718286 RepID=A0A2S2KTC3_9ARCH|nr:MULTISPECIES: hypothetical protein [Nitrosopumilus]MCV0365767.1 hypothetical protein [Nitrosopumilus sp.]BDQ29978.1 hypothetical protein NZOSNM25_000067 [Nitrosopumilus zosterae]GBH34920.1 hypothetical protein NZNM25_17110 [Nitrosopumilus zosterae]
MNSKIFGFLVILLIISIIPTIDAQISFGEKASQKSVEIVINSVGDVHVKHVISKTDLPKQVELIYGTVSNLSVTNEKGEEKQFSVIGDNAGILIFPSDNNSIVEYDLDHAISKKDNVWTWSFRYLETTSFILPEEADLIFANERPIYLDEKKGITCHGCQMILEYSINEPKIYQNIKWEDKEFLVEIRSHSNIDGFVFDQPTKSITFDVSEKNRFVTTIIPLELLWGPYAVFLDDEKIYFNQYINNGTHVWLNIRPETTGEVTIIGTTVVPEFPIIAPLAMGFLIIVITPLIRKVNLR